MPGIRGYAGVVASTRRMRAWTWGTSSLGLMVGIAAIATSASSTSDAIGWQDRGCDSQGWVGYLMRMCGVGSIAYGLADTVDTWAPWVVVGLVGLVIGIALFVWDAYRDE